MNAAADDVPGRGPTPVEDYSPPHPLETRHANLTLVVTRTPNGTGWGYHGVVAAIENLRSGRIDPREIVAVRMGDEYSYRAGAAIEGDTLVVRTAEHGQVLSLEIGRQRA